MPAGEVLALVIATEKEEAVWGKGLLSRRCARWRRFLLLRAAGRRSLYHLRRRRMASTASAVYALMAVSNSITLKPRVVFQEMECCGRLMWDEA
ncbi:hypothetical protein NPIL_347881 [Nephila pilipes]|uniref:Uncharacterized protein n=1 Tax=Nephila pilipes TaxID=299642 RepID=A0A8X6NLY4_NEPPI|nr:hypothetical protein NPIL_347881 [Nephila pilipes]